MAGGVIDGQPVSQAITNPAFIIKNADDTTPSKLGFGNSDPISGGSIINGQREFNSIDSFIGKVSNNAATALPPWTHNDVGGSTNPLFQRLDLITFRFNGVSGIGHEHTGAAGDGPPLPIASISNNPPTPNSVGTTNTIGTPVSFSYGDHQHQGIHSLAVSGGSPIFGDVTFSGSGVSRVGQNFVFTGSGGGGGGSGTQTAGIDNNQYWPQDVSLFMVPASAFAFEAPISIFRTTTSQSLAEDTAFYTNLGTAFNSAIGGATVQLDNKILISGFFTTFNGNTRNRLVRLNSNGTEDSTFYTNLGTAFNNGVNAPAIQADKKILIGGQFTTFNGATRKSLVRLNADGTEDTAFYTNLGSSFNNEVATIAVQPDGKIICGGFFSSFNGNTRNFLLRLNADGTEDTSFYTNLGTGFVIGIFSVLVQEDGKILVGGAFTTFNGNTRNYLVRLNSDGTEDTTFYSAFSGGLNAEILTMALQPDRKILVGGQFTSFNGVTRNHIVRVLTDGNDDTGFYANLGSGFDNDVRAFCVQYDGRIVVGGNFNNLNSISRNAAVRLNADGTEDTAFYTALGTGFNNGLNGIAADQGGNLILAGSYTQLNGNTRNRLVSLVNDSPGYELVYKGELSGIYRPSTTAWTLALDDQLGDDPGVAFSMTSGGQLQYISNNLMGASYSGTMRFVMDTL